ncbi:MAG TPA: formate dehydrogenase accessory sulfurtransferase FdhD [Methylomusa anaerophila]|uniref:Sulfur carrier protein FdhD n=1 Tax=Methylomusa anaerophila TaxID=1930071 RepID=A0A348AFH3_9FIRM|nr:formate dehydrogenase accessory sulfurtransferase FdhD [Methylomusa anaerophila]BBB89821.1 formate dehydrogenase accessory protein [Methylomusa anaerophila]HML89133.1 formate dehydrogenase accessory sulfurtransferase FdhD [Methylomusa anaerophila]
MDIPRGTALHQVIKLNGTEAAAVEEPVVEEVPLTVFLNGKELITMLAAEGEENYLVTGFLASEGIIEKAGDIKSLELDSLQGIVKVETVAGETISEKLFLKRYLTACCGKGRSTFYFANDVLTARTVNSSLQLTPASIVAYSRLLEQQSDVFRLTGGVHGGALAADGKLICFSADIGRHNVFDKIYGRCLLEGISTHDKIIVFTGRVSSEIILKVSKMNIAVIIARSAPTGLALDMAEELGITVIGFARGERCNIYTHSERILLA